MLKRTFNFPDGELLLIDKTIGWTSFDVVNAIRSTIKRTFNIKKIKVGHAGTLDPLATGLLIICTGKFTKHIASFQDLDKSYIGSMYVGATTPSYDKETEVDNTFDISHISTGQLHETASQFVGELEQTPPVFSAVKIEGKRAFEYARKKSEIKLKPRKITIRKFDLLSFDLPDIDFVIECSKGTYIRSLVNDFGKALNNGAYMSSLRRTSIGNYLVSDALSVQEVKDSIMSQGEI